MSAAATERCERLILVPSQLEMQTLNQIESRAEAQECWCTCGVGVLAAAIGTMQRLRELGPQQVVLLGIAGGFAGRAEVGSAFEFDRVAIDGIGAETAGAIRPLARMSFASVAEQASYQPIELRSTPAAESLAAPVELLTVCAASGSKESGAAKAQRFPDAIAEDMEGYAVAAVCQLFGVPLRIVRGISNVAGDRMHSRWQPAPALKACLKVLR